MYATKLTLAVESHFELAQRIDRRIGLEAGFLSNFSDTIRNAVPSFLDSAKSILGGIGLSAGEDIKVKDIDRPAFLRLIDKHNYVHLSSLGVVVPEGFSGNLAEYVKVLEKCAVHASAVVSDVLNPYNTFLSQMLSSHNARLSSFGALGYLAKRDVDREKLNKDVAEHFNMSSTSAKQSYGKVVRRNAEWETVVMTLPSIDKTIKHVSSDAVQKSVDECVELLDIFKKSSQEGTLDNLSGAMVKQLSQATLSVAREVEFYAITSHRAATLQKAVNDSFESIEKALK